jgi:hypothetical protein
MLPQRTQIQIATPKPLTLSGTEAIGGRPTLQLQTFPYFLNRCSLALLIDRKGSCLGMSLVDKSTVEGRTRVACRVSVRSQRLRHCRPHKKAPSLICAGGDELLKLSDPMYTHVLCLSFC